MKIGFEGKLYHGTAGTAAATEATNVKDLTLDFSATEVDATTRANGGYKGYVRGLKDIAISGKSNWDPADAFLAALKTSFIDGTPVAIKMLDVVGGDGPDGDFICTKFPRSENLDGVMEIDWSLKPYAAASRVMDWSEPTPST